MTQLTIRVLQDQARRLLQGRGFVHVGGPVYTGRLMGATKVYDPASKKRVHTRNSVITACITNTPGLTNLDTFLLLNPKESEANYPTENGPPDEYNCVRIEFEHNPEERWWADA